jgi:hypothetical protein
MAVCLAKEVPWVDRAGRVATGRDLSRLIRTSYHGAVGKEGLRLIEGL